MQIEPPIVQRSGDATREALVVAAIDVFARNGFNGATTRAIAEAAGVNQALIGYHFRGKSGLYLAVFEHIADMIEQRVGPIIERLETDLATWERSQPVDVAEQGAAALRRLTSGFAALLTSDDSAAWASLILREQQNPSEGFDLLYARFMSRVLGVIRRLVARVRGSDPDAVETRLTALTIAGQVLVFRAARAAVMRQMGWQRIGVDELAEIERTIHGNISAILMSKDLR